MAICPIPLGRGTESIVGLRDPHMKNQGSLRETPEVEKQNPKTNAQTQDLECIPEVRYESTRKG